MQAHTPFSICGDLDPNRRGRCSAFEPWTAPPRAPLVRLGDRRLVVPAGRRAEAAVAATPQACLLRHPGQAARALLVRIELPLHRLSGPRRGIRSRRALPWTAVVAARSGSRRAGRQSRLQLLHPVRRARLRRWPSVTEAMPARPANQRKIAPGAVGQAASLGWHGLGKQARGAAAKPWRCAREGHGARLRSLSGSRRGRCRGPAPRPGPWISVPGRQGPRR